MPYNTRRKSLSLSELGIQVPKRSRAHSNNVNKEPVALAEEPLAKKPRCSASPLSSPPLNAESGVEVVDVVKSEPAPASHDMLHTPPSSPKPDNCNVKVDTTGIKDEIVVAVIIQLEKTANRPHTSKELAAVLAQNVHTVTSSTNPNALIQARLANYLKGHWPLVSPCPLGKQHETVHPRRVFYHLTTMPHQPIPDSSIVNTLPQRRVISPSLSSNADEEPDAIRARFRLSPSPEIDLSPPDPDGPDVDAVNACMTFSNRSSMSRDASSASLNLVHNTRAISPPLEREERDFKQTANQLQEQRRNSQQASRKSSTSGAASAASKDVKGMGQPTDVIMSTEAPDNTHIPQPSTPAEPAPPSYFEHNEASVGGLTVHDTAPYGLSSPLMRPVHIKTVIGQTLMSRPGDLVDTTIDTVMSEFSANDQIDKPTVWDELDNLQSPETVGFEELESMFDA